MNNEEPIELAHYPGAHPPRPTEIPRIERDDFPAPPFPYTDPERRRRWSGGSSKGNTTEDEEDTESVKIEDDPQLKKEEEELSKIATGIGKVFLKTVREREKIRAWKKLNLDPRNASRTPSADHEPPIRLRYDNPIKACKSISALMYIREHQGTIFDKLFTYTRLQMPNETISEFITALKIIAEKCEFPDLEDRLRDALVCGILNGEIQSMLLMNSMLTFKVAQDMALAHEAAVKNVAEIKDGKPQEEMNVMGRAVKVRRRNEKIFKCFRCGYTNHREEQCFFKDKRCFKCQKLGHISRVCKNGNWRSDRNNCSIDEEAEATNGLFNINQVKDTSNMRNYMVKVRTSGRDMNMLIDSGTRKNIISEKTYIETWVKSERPRIEKDSTKLVQWNRQRLSILGKIKADVKVNKRSITMELLVIEGPGPNLIGREAFDQIGIGLEWISYGDSVCQINEVMNGNGMAAAMNGNGNGAKYGNGNGMAAAMNGNGNGMAAYMNGNGMAAMMNGNGGKYANGMMSGANGMGAGYMNGGEDMYSEGDGLSVYGNPGVDFPLFASVPETSFQCRQQELPGYYADQEGPTKAGGNTWAV
ncbi:ABLIM3 [Cordylochernes scorpioides]|uniref:ABLIM3 n=1 Tax=Cordylochernes scorpioides TaxID=51811 RepID=A0ABY6K3K9_9ARAC|nr:ABLIM3 [Cordylochernes scorpioides]